MSKINSHIRGRDVDGVDSHVSILCVPRKIASEIGIIFDFYQYSY